MSANTLWISDQLYTLLGINDASLADYFVSLGTFQPIVCVFFGFWLVCLFVRNKRFFSAVVVVIVVVVAVVVVVVVVVGGGNEKAMPHSMP
jgi:hypothetical protein